MKETLHCRKRCPYKPVMPDGAASRLIRLENEHLFTRRIRRWPPSGALHFPLMLALAAITPCQTTVANAYAGNRCGNNNLKSK
ncbi:hypothetical protein KCP70_05375 [Salmonella enterica subsp. enterica]|nr:hypothetical protein KCP70_05375 [Salmonella enterica subsp. enterica]